MIRPLVKICGITNLRDAQYAIASGADMIGFIFCASPRELTVEDAVLIRQELGEDANVVGVFRDQPVEVVNDVANRVDLKYVQLHGDEPAELIGKILRPVIKTINYSFDASQGEIDFRQDTVEQFEQAAYIIVDCQKGTEAPLSQLKTRSRRDFLEVLRLRVESMGLKRERLFLAGGLNRDTVADACSIVQPAGVDVCSGVEDVPGSKSERLIDSFMDNLNGLTLAPSLDAEYRMKRQVASARWRGSQSK